ncbi:voltage-gated hydrogen channel 1 [Latimeria chalumnae]|uniref:voltage-gated hydrogen channel 1 n=1 Tax=Latimeria chalumnae TaxID=7897 RepID=UPI0003C10637|nr:PREDICTED: voltage-gated hydrogen channel 1 [Latimeria chalumnae]XP_005996473.1 PREDICTED: voltage-gated hydrogen channel 1 [Latimeria chalumnae]XP_005996474.1 PREDICTED: voltage-gated hydrogen channel 1 [Latimeria chalumnae]XP_014344097.1 PREDICTED: voltage-gated hydrogen channel 1 [Latimeria chalumnae]XP_014344098.1 PREDICTED: voltage-gated hydrogen channel 1 [Latimeria chalumnae]|eukprot:XP_005996472.1 PREDICTED: voltage-gated hydrogen channel 1 [Latimeria chalumnae]
MSKILRHFTAVGDDYKEWQGDDDINWQVEDNYESLNASTEPAKHSTEPLSFRSSLKWLFNCHKFQIAVICLVILDAIFVLCELLMDLSIIKTDKGRIAPQVLHYLSIAILTGFLLEVIGKLYAYRLEFFHHKFEVLDAIVVVISFLLDIIYISHEDAFDAMGLLILLRLWRVARIINGIIISVQSQAHQKISKLKEDNERHLNRVNELQQLCEQQDQELKRLRQLLQQHGINDQMN